MFDIFIQLISTTNKEKNQNQNPKKNFLNDRNKREKEKRKNEREEEKGMNITGIHLASSISLGSIEIVEVNGFNRITKYKSLLC
jgi:hypothetical protein